MAGPISRGFFKNSILPLQPSQAAGQSRNLPLWRRGNSFVETPCGFRLFFLIIDAGVVWGNRCEKLELTCNYSAQLLIYAFKLSNVNPDEHLKLGERISCFELLH
jgi:hypothetical protein